MDGQADHGRADAVDHVDDGTRIGVEQRLVLGWNFGTIGCGGAAAPGGIVQGYDFHGISRFWAGIAPASGEPARRLHIWERDRARGRAALPLPPSPAGGGG